MERSVGGTRVRVVRGDVTEQVTDAIVNAANAGLMGGGGVDGAIHRRGGPAILEECRAIVARQGGCPTGEAVITAGGRLPARHVIHAVGPVWRGGQHDEDRLLASAYRSSLRLAIEHRLRSIAFPSISTGAYGFPIGRAAPIALATVRDVLLAGGHDLGEVRFVLFSEPDRQVYATALEQLAERVPGDAGREQRE